MKKTLIEIDEDAVESLPKKRSGCGFRLLLRLLVLAALVFVGFCGYIDYYGHVDRARPADAIVILGARVGSDHRPGDSLTARTRQAVALYRRKLAAKIICTGGLGDYAPTEAQATATLAIRMGVPERDLLLETKSTNTTENTRNTAVICRRHGWTRVVAVSDPYHLWRVQRDFRTAGLIAYTSPALTCERDRKLPLRLQWTAREGAAVSRDLLVSAAQWVWTKVRKISTSIKI